MQASRRDTLVYAYVIQGYRSRRIELHFLLFSLFFIGISNLASRTKKLLFQTIEVKIYYPTNCQENASNYRKNTSNVESNSRLGILKGCKSILYHDNPSNEYKYSRYYQ